MSTDITALPSELLVTPQPLIGFCGLDVQRNVVHKSVWDAFSSNRKTDRPAVQYKLLPASYDFPVAKPKRASYEWYHPKGILKRNWMLKHLHVLPSVVVLFQDMEWNDTQWTEKQLQCAATIQSLKNSLQERNTRLCLVLLQKAAPLPPGEDMLATERASSLTTACGLGTKMLFILPHTEHLMGYTQRLESAFLDMAQSYYALMSKRIRTHRDQLTAAHTVLRIRHQFKLGFVAELRQDLSTGLKHYTQSYANLEEIRIIDTNCLEIKTIAGFLNYKICRLMFKLKVPRDSINQFISHIEKYKNRVGFRDLVFEHYAWLSTQHSAFADLFCEAIKNGLPALQTQHPGIYYHKAAEYTAKRRESYLQCCALSPAFAEPTSPTTMQNISSMSLFSEYFGIRAVKTGEPMSEQQLIFLVQEHEKNFKHSNVIIQMLGQAMAQFKVYKCLRFRKKLAIDMAEEYFKCGDHSKAMTLYSLMLPDYRQDKWPSILSDVLLKTLRCAFLSSSVIDFISCSIEVLSLKVSTDQKDRLLVLENLWKVFQGLPPISQTQIAPELRGQWETALAATKSPIQIDLDKITELLDCFVTFERAELKNNEVINVFLILKLHTNVPIKLHNFAINLSDGNKNVILRSTKFTAFSNLMELRDAWLPAKSSAIIYATMENELKMDSNKYYQFLFTTEAQRFFENTQLYVTRIEALMGTDKLCALLLKSVTFARNAFRHHNRYRDLDDNITINQLCYIAPTFHVSTQTDLGNDPMLVNEYHLVMTTVNNPHDVFLQNVGININVPDNLKNKVFLTTEVSPGRQKLHSQIQIDIGDLAMHSSNTASFYVFSLIETSIELQQAISYNVQLQKSASPENLPTEMPTTASSNESSPVDSDPNARNLPQLAIAPLPSIHIELIDDNRLRKTREETLSIRCVNEFKFVGSFYTLNRKALIKIYQGENFLLRTNIEVTSECALDIVDTYFICDHNLEQSTYSFYGKKYTNTYRTGEKLEEVIVLRTNATLNDWLTSKEIERNKTAPECRIFSRTRNLRKHHHHQHHTGNINRNAVDLIGSSMNKSLIAKIPTNMTIVNNTLSSSIMFNSQNTSILNTSIISDDGGASTGHDVIAEASASGTQKSSSTRMIYNKAIDALQATGRCRGFIKGITTMEPQEHSQQSPVFGVYCIKWRRSGGSKQENESKFVIVGKEIEKPPLNIYCSIEERIFVKMPLTLKVVLKNPTEQVLHLMSSLNTTNSDKFICSGHKQLDISIFAQAEKELIYNLYPLAVGWQMLPELTLEYNTLADPTKDEAQNNLLNELVLRSMPKRVFVLPSAKHQIK